MIFEIFKNPIVLGILAGTVAYLYLLWNNEKKYKNAKDKNEKNKKDINLMVPLIIAVIVCIMSYAYFYSSDVEKKDTIDLTETLNLKSGMGMEDKVGTRYKFSDGNIHASVNKLAFSPESATEFHLMSKGLNIPNKAVPDVFMETFS